MAKEIMEAVIQEEEKTAGESTTVESSDDDNNRIVKFKKPYKFEGKEYTEIDLSGMEDLRASDMIAVDNYMRRTAGTTSVNMMPEVSMEYACVFASKATQLPIEFFTSLPSREALKVKNRVVGFFLGLD
jgi:hypothetical protein